MKIQRAIYVAVVVCVIFGVPWDRPILAAELNVGVEGIDFRDPQDSSDLNYYVFQRLVERATDGQLISGVADSWERSDNTWQFNLAKDILFQNGDELDAEDVEFSIERAAEGVRPDLSNVEVEKVDLHTIRITSPEPQFLLEQLQDLHILSQTAKGLEPDEILLKAVGSGPYSVEQWEPGDRAILRKYEGYRPGGNFWDRITIFRVPDDNARIAGLLTSELHVIAPVPPISARQLERKPGINVVRTETDRLVFLQFGPLLREGALFSDKRVRQAVALIIDRAGLMEASQLTPFVKAESLWLGQRSAPETVYDEAKAQELFQEAGKPSDIVDIFVNSRENDRYAGALGLMAQEISKSLKKIGLNTQVRLVAWAEFRKGLPSRKPWILLRSGHFGTPGLAMRDFFGTGGRRNYAEWSSSEFDSFLEKGNIADAASTAQHAYVAIPLMRREFIVGLRDDYLSPPMRVGRAFLAFLQSTNASCKTCKEGYKHCISKDNKCIKKTESCSDWCN